MPHIEGVEIKELVTHPDERGFFREIIRVTDPFSERASPNSATRLMHLAYPRRGTSTRRK